MSIPGYRQVSGSYGMIWWDGERIAEVLEFEAKVVANREDVLQAGSNDIDSKMMSLKGEGRMKLKKVYSRGAKKLLKAWQNGNDPRSKLKARVNDPDAYGAESCDIDGVWFNDLNALQFAVGQKTETEYTFGFPASQLKMDEVI
jgi:hypothetical protein